MTSTDLIVCYKTVFGLIKVEFNNFFSFAPANNTRSHGYKLFVEQSTRNIRYYSFCRRVVNPWNNLPHNTVDFSSLSKFKHCLIRADLSKYLLYCIDWVSCECSSTGAILSLPVMLSLLAAV